MGGFRLLERLGEGGQGTVWRAVDLADQAPVAVKLVRAVGVAVAGIERLRREARILAELDHPSLPKCARLFEDFDGVVGFAMEFASGSALASLVDDPRWTDELRTQSLLHVLGALAYVHARGLAHRDVKLENVIIQEEFWSDPADPRHVTLVDFGIASPLDGGTGLTASQAVVGTFRALAPERLNPDRFPATTLACADVFSFGVLACEMSGGGHPTGMPRETGYLGYVDAYAQSDDGERAWPAKMPRLLPESIALRALCLRPADRFVDAGAIQVAWAADPPATDARARKPRRRGRRALWRGLGAVAVAILGVIGWWSWRPRFVVLAVVKTEDGEVALAKRRHWFPTCHTEKPLGAWDFCTSSLWLVVKQGERAHRYPLQDDLYLPDWDVDTPAEWWVVPTGALEVSGDTVRVFSISKDGDRTFNVTGRYSEYSLGRLEASGPFGQPQALVRATNLFQNENCGWLARFEANSLVAFSSYGHFRVRLPLEPGGDQAGPESDEGEAGLSHGICRRYQEGPLRADPDQERRLREESLRATSGGLYPPATSGALLDRYDLVW